MSFKLALIDGDTLSGTFVSFVHDRLFLVTRVTIRLIGPFNLNTMFSIKEWTCWSHFHVQSTRVNYFAPLPSPAFMVVPHRLHVTLINLLNLVGKVFGCSIILSLVKFLNIHRQFCLICNRGLELKRFEGENRTVFVILVDYRWVNVPSVVL